LAGRLALDPDGPRTIAGLADLVERAADAGIDLVQMRESDLAGDAATRWARRFVEIVKGTETRIIVNDRLDVALAAGAHGVHLKDGPVAIDRIRAAAPTGFVIGQSIHSPNGVVSTGADYLVFGTVFSTRSKPHLNELAGLEGLREAVRNAPVPVLCIGGVKRAYLAAIAGTGAAGIAAVDLFLPDGPGLVAPLRETARQVRHAFDTARPAS
jgi:thiamine-phosphate diphosphorylase